MASSPARLCFGAATVVVLCALAPTAQSGLMLTVVNNCPYTIWPAIQPNAGQAVLEGGGFILYPYNHRSFPASAAWSGRIWARTGCAHQGDHFICETGDCDGRLQCNGAGGASPVTLAQFSLHHGGNADLSSYAISLVDGFNVPATVTPHEGTGRCPVVGCRVNLVATCPEGLQHRAAGGRGAVVACKSGCEAVRSDSLCCRNHFNSPHMCRPSIYSDFFKHACPSTFTYAHDSPSLIPECSSPRELKVIFCH